MGEVVPKILARDVTLQQLQEIEQLAKKNRSLKEIRSVLNLDGRSFLRSFKDPTSEIYKAFRRGIDYMEIRKDEVLIARIEGENLTALEIHEKRRAELEFKLTIAEVFGI